MRSLLTLFFLTCATVAADATAANDVEVLVASDRTVAGRNFVPPSALKPAYYLLATAGPQEMGIIYANDRLPPRKTVEPYLIKALARQFYFPVDARNPNPDYVIIYAWGSINPDHMDIGGLTNRYPETQSLGAQRLERQILSIVATNKMDLPMRGLAREQFLSSMTDGRYFLLVSAYDHEAMASGKKPRGTMLWRTRLSVNNLLGIDLAAAIPMMLDAAPTAFGADGYPKTVPGKLRPGRVEIGEAKTLNVVKNDAVITAKMLYDAVGGPKTSRLPPEKIAAMKRAYLEQWQDPQYLVGQAQSMKALQVRNYATFIKRAKFSPEASEQFLQLMTEKVLSYSKILAEELKKADTAPALRTTRAKSLQADAQYKAQLAQFMGDERFKQFENYTRTLAGRVQVERVILARGPHSFTDTQMDLFAEVFTNILKEWTKQGDALPKGTTLNDMFLTSVQGHVSSEEMKTLSELFQRRGTK